MAPPVTLEEKLYDKPILVVRMLELPVGVHVAPMGPQRRQQAALRGRQLAPQGIVGPSGDRGCQKGDQQEGRPEAAPRPDHAHGCCSLRKATKPGSA